MNETKFKINRRVLAEMNELACFNKLDTSALTYTEAQQVLTLQSLIDVLAEFNIDLGIELSIPELKPLAENDGDD
jgi:hypothetical protein